MTRLVLFAVLSLAMSAAAQNYVSPAVLENARRFTTHAPLPQYSASARARHLEGSGLYLFMCRRMEDQVDSGLSAGRGVQVDGRVHLLSPVAIRPEIAATTHKVKIPMTFSMAPH